MYQGRALEDDLIVRYRQSLPHQEEWCDEWLSWPSSSYKEPQVTF